jgi:hypothetical protein
VNKNLLLDHFEPQLTLASLNPVQYFIQRQEVLTLHLVDIAEQQNLH